MLVITSTFGDGGPPDNGAGFWDRIHSADAPALDGIRYAVLGIGDRSYANFCGHAKAIDGRLAALGATRMLERAECEAYDDEPMDRWAEQVTALVAAPAEPSSSNGGGGGVSTIARPTTAAEPFTRAKPILAPLSRNIVLTAPTSRKEVRQIGFDISEYNATYAAGDSLGVYSTNNPATVDAWLAATGLRGDTSVEVDGNEQSLRDALIVSYDICRVTPNLLRFVAESCADKAAAKALLAPRDKLDKWLVNRNGLDIVQEFTVRAEPEQWQEVLVRLTPRNYSISSSPLVSPHEVQLTVSVVRYRGADGGQRGGVCSTFLADRAAAAPVFLQRSPHFRPPEDGDDADDHGRSRHRDRAVPRLPAGAACARPRRPATGCSSATSTAAKTSTTATIWRTWSATASSIGWIWHSPAIRPTGSTSSTRCSTTAPTCGGGSTMAGTSTCAGTPAGWRRTWTPRSPRSFEGTARCPKRAHTTTSVSWWRPSATSATCIDLQPSVGVGGDLHPHVVSAVVRRTGLENAVQDFGTFLQAHQAMMSARKG